MDRSAHKDGPGIRKVIVRAGRLTSFMQNALRRYPWEARPWSLGVDNLANRGCHARSDEGE
jgi:hypothetical protein